jgi:hypothetical protein
VQSGIVIGKNTQASTCPRSLHILPLTRQKTRLRANPGGPHVLRRIPRIQHSDNAVAVFAASTGVVCSSSQERRETCQSLGWNLRHSQRAKRLDMDPYKVHSAALSFGSPAHGKLPVSGRNTVSASDVAAALELSRTAAIVFLPASLMRHDTYITWQPSCAFT